jgi:hypothetical protein
MKIHTHTHTQSTISTMLSLPLLNVMSPVLSCRLDPYWQVWEALWDHSELPAWWCCTFAWDPERGRRAPGRGQVLPGAGASWRVPRCLGGIVSVEVGGKSYRRTGSLLWLEWNKWTASNKWKPHVWLHSIYSIPSITMSLSYSSSHQSPVYCVLP